METGHDDDIGPAKELRNVIAKAMELNSGSVHFIKACDAVNDASGNASIVAAPKAPNRHYEIETIHERKHSV